MKAKDLLEKYPIASEVIKEWWYSEFKKSLNTEDIPKDYKEFLSVYQITDDMLINLIDNSPRALFDVFDENEIYIELFITIESPINWTFGINRNSVSTAIYYSSRKEAETEAITQAFALLEEKLTPIKFEKLEENENN